MQLVSPERRHLGYQEGVHRDVALHGVPVRLVQLQAQGPTDGFVQLSDLVGSAKARPIWGRKRTQ